MIQGIWIPSFLVPDLIVNPPLGLTYKVCGCHAVTILKRTPVFDRCVVRWGTKNKRHNDWKEIWFVSSICIDYSTFDMQINWKDLCFIQSRSHITLSKYTDVFHSIVTIDMALHLLTFTRRNVDRGRHRCWYEQWIMSVWTIRIFPHKAHISNDNAATNNIFDEQRLMWIAPGAQLHPSIGLISGTVKSCPRCVQRLHKIELTYSRVKNRPAWLNNIVRTNMHNQ